MAAVPRAVILVSPGLQMEVGALAVRQAERLTTKYRSD